MGKLMEKNEMLVISNFTFSHSVLYSLKDIIKHAIWCLQKFLSQCFLLFKGDPSGSYLIQPLGVQFVN